MTELKSYSEVWREHKRDSVITYILFVVVFYLLAGVMWYAPWYYNVAFALLASFLLMLGCLYFQRYT